MTALGAPTLLRWRRRRPCRAGASVHGVVATHKESALGGSPASTRPGIPVGRHGPGAGDGLPGCQRRSGGRPTRRSASRSPARLGRPRRRARPDRQRAARAPGGVDRGLPALGGARRGEPTRRRGDAAEPRSTPATRWASTARWSRPASSPRRRLRLVRERGRLMQASAGDGAMAAIIGLDDERVAGPRWRPGAARASSRSPTATRPARSWSVASAPRSRRPRRPPRSLGAKRAHRAAGQRRRPLAADGRRGRGHARALAGRRVRATPTRRCWPTPTRAR